MSIRRAPTGAIVPPTGDAGRGSPLHRSCTRTECPALGQLASACRRSVDFASPSRTHSLTPTRDWRARSALDPELPFRIGSTKGRKALESGLRLKASIASENRRLPIRSITHHRRRFSRWVRNRRAKVRLCWSVTSASSCELSGGCPFSRPGRSRRPRRARHR
jgi:hypothetical protein